jgi:hypothetical protein
MKPCIGSFQHNRFGWKLMAGTGKYVNSELGWDKSVSVAHPPTGIEAIR